MIETLVVATDGSESVRRAVGVALDLARRFEADVHALYVVDEGDVSSSPADVRAELRDGLTERGEGAVAEIVERAPEGVSVEAAVREGRPAPTIVSFAREIDADAVAMGTRGRHGENRFLLGSVAESVVRTCPMPVLTVRQLAGGETEDGEGGGDGDEGGA
jgi:nucleotide-binding universal stress UspA family protein